MKANRGEALGSLPGGLSTPGVTAMQPTLRFVGLLGICCAGACSSQNQVASKYAKSQLVSASQGGIVTVTYPIMFSPGG